MNKKKKFILAALIIGILAVVAGFGLLNTRGNTPPRTVVERFYGSWIAALADESGPFEQGLHTRSTYVTKAFGEAVERANERGRDAVLCIGGAMPTTFLIKDAVLNKQGTAAGVDFVADGVEGHVVLEKGERNWWRINEVDCPRVAPTATTTPNTDTASSTLP